MQKRCLPSTHQLRLEYIFENTEVEIFIDKNGYQYEEKMI